MCAIKVCLFEKFQALMDGQEIQSLNARKVGELFAYLLIYREHKHTRESLASLLWPSSTVDQAGRYFRQTLWKLQTALNSVGANERNRILVVDPDRWIFINPEAGVWLDVSEFERIYRLVQKTPGAGLDAQGEQAVQQALMIYKGDLLEGWYQEWCSFERDRLKCIYLTLVEKEMDFCTLYGTYESGLMFGTRALHCDIAHEGIHSRLMQLYYLSGDRTAALRQYDRCTAVLNAELGVRPSVHTMALYQQICADLPLAVATEIWGRNSYNTRETASSLLGLRPDLKRLLAIVSEAESQLQHIIQALEEPPSDRG